MENRSETLWDKALQRRLVTVGLVVLFFLLWEAAAARKLAGLFIWDFFVRPSLIVPALVQLLMAPPFPEYNLLQHASVTLVRALLSLGLGIGLAVPLGMMLGWWRRLDDLFTPLIEFLRPTPSLILFPMLLLLFGTGSVSKIAASALAVFFIVLLNSIYGAKGVDRVAIDALRVMGASNMQIFRKLVFYAALPHVAAGVRVSIGASMLVIISTEMIQGTSGLGFLIYFSLERFQHTYMLVAIFTTMALGAMSVSFWLLLERKILDWHFEQAKRG